MEQLWVSYCPDSWGETMKYWVLDGPIKTWRDGDCVKLDMQATYWMVPKPPGDWDC